jgi:hypothetical protein
MAPLYRTHRTASTARREHEAVVVARGERLPPDRRPRIVAMTDNALAGDRGTVRLTVRRTRTNGD